MRAAVLHEFGEPLKLEDVPRPAPGEGEVLLKVEACGVCHSDLHIANGDWPAFAGLIRRPLVPGHEVVGRVAEVGAGVKELKPGDRAGVAWVYWSCGACDACQQGRENLCAARAITGVTVNGGYAEWMLAKASHALKVPEELSSPEAAPVFCAGVTVYRAAKNAGIAAGQRVGVFGVGGLGHLAIQVARAFGANVTAVDVAEEKLRLAAELGATATLDASAKATSRAIREAGGLDVALVTSAAKAAYDLAFSCLRTGGAMVVIGLPAELLSFDATLLTAGENRILSSAVGTRQDVRETLAMAAAGKLRCRVETRPLDKINEIFGRMRAGKIIGRTVVAPA